MPSKNSSLAAAVVTAIRRSTEANASPAVSGDCEELRTTVSHTAVARPHVSTSQWSAPIRLRASP